MRKVARTASILAISVLTAGAALADTGHHDKDTTGPDVSRDARPMGAERHEMMQSMMRIMMQMHGSGVVSPGMGFMAGPGMGGMSMMDRDMMQMMMGPAMMQGLPDGMPGRMMRSRLEDYDANGDGELNLEEFAAWHASMLRETMVDRFQHIDADGDGAVTSEEMRALAGRMNRIRANDEDDRPVMRDMPDQN
ncbi:calcium-binding protein [Psychromarinibacter halotolerans]|uniref:Calcium-binding protein n=1 Tax=Psychromarinibacter halotolerans TaxID=1775175 RepID=A0ABV7GNC2_9RHOB|nr:calcium-binding protein [Psychromarinibacter halotolerans]MDF0596878.1 calcium-binding protein [Psychromarinibacter halotolerans]